MYSPITNTYYVPVSPQRFLEQTNKRSQPILTLIRGTRSGTQDALTPTNPILISKNSASWQEKGDDT